MFAQLIYIFTLTVRSARLVGAETGQHINLIYPVPVMSTGEVTAPRVVNIWSIQRDPAPARRQIHSSVSNWTECGPWCACDGELRIGDKTNSSFSLPVTTSSNISCSVGSFRSQLWPSVSSSTPTACECRQPSSYRLVARDLCLVRPGPGWPGPGLVSCTYFTPNDGWKYLPASGQIRVDGKCLTAFPYDLTLTNNWRPWGIRLSDCSSAASPSERQSWDVPDGIDEDQSSLFTSTDGEPVGHLGRISLRGSSDIGTRCLDISLTPVKLSTDYRVVQLEAILCDDVRYRKSDFLFFRFYRINSNNLNFSKCTTPECSDCRDGEIRVVDGDTGSVLTQSVPNTGIDGICGLDSLKKMLVGEKFDGGRCYCQPSPIASQRVEGRGRVGVYGYDDLPTKVEGTKWIPRKERRK
jgi:hypothetical protein